MKRDRLQRGVTQLEATITPPSGISSPGCLHPSGVCARELAVLQARAEEAREQLARVRAQMPGRLHRTPQGPTTRADAGVVPTVGERLHRPSPLDEAAIMASIQGCSACPIGGRRIVASPYLLRQPKDA